MFLKKPENIYSEPEISIKDLSLSEMLQRARASMDLSTPDISEIENVNEEKTEELAEEIEEEPVPEPASDPPETSEEHEIHPAFEALLNKLTHEERVLLFDELHGKKGAFEEAFPSKPVESISAASEIQQETISQGEQPLIDVVKDKHPTEEHLVEENTKDDSDDIGLNSIQTNLGIDAESNSTILGVTVDEKKEEKEEEPKSKDWYNRPEGWNKGSSGSWSSPSKPPITKPKPYKPKKKSLLKIWWMVITDKEGLEPKEFARYDNVMAGKIKPAFFSIVIAFIIILCLAKGGITSTAGEKYSENDKGPLDKFINWIVEKYDNATGRNNPVIYNTSPVTKTDSIISLQPDSTGYLIPSDPSADQPIELNPDTFYEPVHKKIVLHDTFHYYRTDTVLKKVIIVDTQLAKPKESSIHQQKPNHLDSILHRNQ
jgi:hypothetical protein